MTIKPTVITLEIYKDVKWSLLDSMIVRTHMHTLAFSQSDEESVITGLEHNHLTETPLTKEAFGEPRACPQGYT